MERWLAVAGAETRYEVSDAGRIRSLWSPRGKRSQARILVGGIDSSGYRQVVICLGHGERRMMLYHHLVIDAFGPPRPANACLVRHLDCNKLNNYATNLAYGTPQDNANGQLVAGLTFKGERHPRATVTDKTALVILQATGTAKAIAAQLNIPVGTVYSVRSADNWKHLK